MDQNFSIEGQDVQCNFHIETSTLSLVNNMMCKHTGEKICLLKAKINKCKATVKYFDVFSLSNQHSFVNHKNNTDLVSLS